MNNIEVDAMPPAMILCGGQGTRLRDVTELLPKPMVPVGPQPIIWHIMKIYASFGVRRFILCLGYKRETFIDYFINYHARSSDITVRTGKHGGITYHNSHREEDWEVTLADTGEYSMTGTRVRRAAKYLKETDEDFFLTYGDAVSNIDIAKELKIHRASGKMLTISAVHPTGRFGEMEFIDNKLTTFYEKPQTTAGFINGGFMVAKKAFPFKYIAEDTNLSLEDKPIRTALAEDQVEAYQHSGFWQCMDTPREHGLLNNLWDSGFAPWAHNW